MVISNLTTKKIGITTLPTGEKLTGWQNVDGVILYFDKDGKQVKGQEREIGGKYYRFDENDGSLLTNQWHHTSISMAIGQNLNIQLILIT